MLCKNSMKSGRNHLCLRPGMICYVETDFCQLSVLFKYRKQYLYYISLHIFFRFTCDKTYCLYKLRSNVIRKLINPNLLNLFGGELNFCSKKFFYLIFVNLNF